MPIYRYRCGNCGGHEEHLQKVSDPPKQHCAKCGGELAKQMTAAAFHLKGGGWYKDLYSSAGKSGEAGSTSSSSDSGSSASSSSGGEGSSSTSTSSAPTPAAPASNTSTTSSSSSAA
jgi:putative FmdB family regulatory protein